MYHNVDVLLFYGGVMFVVGVGDQIDAEIEWIIRFRVCVWSLLKLKILRLWNQFGSPNGSICQCVAVRCANLKFYNTVMLVVHCLRTV